MMLRFIVLGLIPGTQSEMSFGFILGCVAAAIIMAMLYMKLAPLRHLIGQILPGSKTFVGTLAHSFSRLRGFLHKASILRV